MFRRMLAALRLIGNSERKLITNTISSSQHNDWHVDKLVDYIRSTEFKWIPVGSRDFISPGGLMFFCDDICGFEVKLLSSSGELLDCRPSYYNLKQSQALKIYEALVDRYNTRTVEV